MGNVRHRRTGKEQLLWSGIGGPDPWVELRACPAFRLGFAYTFWLRIRISSVTYVCRSWGSRRAASHPCVVFGFGEAALFYLRHDCRHKESPRTGIPGLSISQAVRRQTNAFRSSWFIAAFPAWFLEEPVVCQSGRAFVGSQTSKGKNEPISPNDRGFRAPCQKRRGRSGAPGRPKGLRKQLHLAKDMAAVLPGQGRDYAYARTRVGPGLKAWAVPQTGEASLSRLGLSLPRNSQNRPRPGISGISVHGKKVLADSCRLMEDFRKRTAMWTVTLLDEDYEFLAQRRKWPEFQRRVIDLLIRLLKAHGDEAVVVACVEVGEKRFARTGRPDPHIHVVTTGWGRRHPDGGWLLCPQRMDELVAKACQYVGLPSAERPAASRVEPVRHSVSSYLSKYLTKQLPVSLESVSPEMQELIPRQWWNRSAACKAMLEGSFVDLPPAFAAFLVRNAISLERLELGKGGVRTVGWKKTKLAELPIECFCFKFRSPGTLMQAMELFALWVDNEEQLDLSGLVMSG